MTRKDAFKVSVAILIASAVIQAAITALANYHIDEEPSFQAIVTPEEIQGEEPGCSVYPPVRDFCGHSDWQQGKVNPSEIPPASAESKRYQ